MSKIISKRVLNGELVIPASKSGIDSETIAQTKAIKNIFTKEKSLKRIDFPKTGRV